MHPSIAEKRDQIQALCRRFHVRRLEVFGSAAGGAVDFDPATSDADFLVQFEPAPPQGLFDAYFDLRQSLSTLLGREVDLIVTGAVRNPYVRATIEQSRELIHGA
jgi:uncharacterized protein